MVSKPCERQPKGCVGLVYAEGAKHLEKRRFCCRQCAYLNRVETGTWHHPVIPIEARRRGAKLAARKSAETRRKKSVVAVVARVAALIPKDLADVLSVRHRAALKALMGRVWRVGYKTGYRTGRQHAGRHSKRGRPPAAVREGLIA